jgi:predicted aspartyl protease
LIAGIVSDEGVPLITLEIAGQEWQTIVDTGFNGDLEHPARLFSLLPREYLGRTFSELAGGQQIEEDSYAVQIRFDGHLIRAAVTFAPGDQVLLGTHFIRAYRLEIDFRNCSLRLNRS